MDFPREILGSWWPVLSPDQHQRLVARSGLLYFSSLLIFRLRAVTGLYLLSFHLTECGRAKNRYLGGICLRLGEGASYWRHLLRRREEMCGASGFLCGISWIASVLVMLVRFFNRRH